MIFHARLGPPRAPRPSLGAGALNAAALVWFLVIVIGQWLFLYYIAAFYGASTLTGHFENWNRLSAIGRTPYRAGDTQGNLVYAAHALAAGFIAFGGALQLIPRVRKRAPRFHRYNGRLYLLIVTALSLSGFYLVWVRRTSPSVIDGLSTSFNGVLILTFAFLALRSAMARNIAEHQRWAMRLYLVSNGQWFLRIGVFSYFVISRMLGNKVGIGDPFVEFWAFGCYLVPLAILQLYFIAKERDDSFARIAVAGGLLALTVPMAIGIFAFSMFSQTMISGAPVSLPR